MYFCSTLLKGQDIDRNDVIKICEAVSQTTGRVPVPARGEGLGQVLEFSDLMIDNRSYIFTFMLIYQQ